MATEKIAALFLCGNNNGSFGSRFFLLNMGFWVNLEVTEAHGNFRFVDLLPLGSMR